MVVSTLGVLPPKLAGQTADTLVALSNAAEKAGQSCSEVELELLSVDGQLGLLDVSVELLEEPLSQAVVLNLGQAVAIVCAHAEVSGAAHRLWLVAAQVRRRCAKERTARQLHV